MSRLEIEAITLSIRIEEKSQQRTDFELLVSSIELLINTVDPRKYAETKDNYSHFYDKILMAIAHHIVIYADMPIEHTSMYDLLIDEINELRPR